MTPEQQVAAYLNEIEQVLKKYDLWHTSAPDAAAFTSVEPFCIDTMHALEWLQWILIPRMRALLDAQRPLPGSFALAPYYEMALEADLSGRTELLLVLSRLDAVFTDGQV